MFSVVIPLYNKEDNIANTLDSVLAQTFQDFEIIIVNDGSTDKSLQIVSDYEDIRIKVYSKPNGGVSDARNYGIKKSSNKYVAFMDADDYWKPNYLERMFKLIEDYPTGGMYNCEHTTIYKGKYHPQEHNIKRGIVDDYFKKSLETVIAWTSATIVRRDIFEKVGYFPVGMVSGEDVYMWTKIAIKYPVVFTPEELTIYYKTDGTIVERVGKKDTCKESWFDFYSENNHDLNKFIAYKALATGKRYAWGGLTNEGKIIEDRFRYATKIRGYKPIWRELFILNRTPSFVKNLILKYRKNLSK